jgi:hypothetical protein
MKTTEMMWNPTSRSGNHWRLAANYIEPNGRVSKRVRVYGSVVRDRAEHSPTFNQWQATVYNPPAVPFVSDVWFRTKKDAKAWVVALVRLS